MHNHQPVGNFDSIFQEGVDNCYLPFLEEMSKRNLRFSVHTSGPLLEWMDRGAPRYHDLLRQMTSDGRVEMIGGGYYEPILSIWPKELAAAQIRLMRHELKKRYNADARGLWLAERVWDPSLPELLAGADVEYTVLDDSHFLYAGLMDDPITGYYITERAGARVAVLPISKQLRYYIPFREPEIILDFLRSVAERNPGAIVTYADDGEKFGMWPGTKDWVYNRGWLNRFLDAIEGARDWLEVIPLGDALKYPPQGRIYLPCASYEEMMEWALPADTIQRYENVLRKIKQHGLIDEAKPFLRGGFWDNFLVKYPESNLMHKRLLLAAKNVEKHFGIPDEMEKLPEAWRNIFRAQCNCAYWHGLFGGVYMNYLRHAIWQRMLKAESALIDENDNEVKVSQCDVDYNGKDEILVFDGIAGWGFKQDSAACFLNESLTKSFAFHNVMFRRPEAYHFLKQKPEGVTDHCAEHAPVTIHDVNTPMKERPVYDRAPRFCFVDHFFPLNNDIQSFQQSSWYELGDFWNSVWESEWKSENGAATVRFRRQGYVSGMAVNAEKEYRFKAGSGVVEAKIRFEPSGQWPEGRYGAAFNFTLLAPDAPDRYYLFNGVRPQDARMLSEGAAAGVKSFAAIDDYLGLGLEWEVTPTVEVWRAPIYTVSRSEEGFDKSYQGSWVMAVTPLPRSTEPIEMTIKWKQYLKA